LTNVTNLSHNFWHFTPTIENLLTRWCHQLWPSLGNCSICFNLCPYYLDLWPFDL